MIPVPPLPEQNRIVAKVNELMALCDTLETKLIQSREDADRFAAAVVNRIDGRTVKLHSKIQSVF
jgi:type I restriction enzyme S subunit